LIDAKLNGPTPSIVEGRNTAEPEVPFSRGESDRATGDMNLPRLLQKDITVGLEQIP
jgi:hypothetical protein